MTAQTHARVKALFLAALDRPARERSAFLAEAAHDAPELRQQVEALLGYHVESDAFDGPGTGAEPRLDAGSLVAGRYRLTVPLGSGGTGDVWEAEDHVVGGSVALKFVHAEHPVARALLVNEVRLARQVTHPNVCRVFDVGEHAGEAFLSMELIRGEDLASKLRRDGRIPLETALDWAHQISAGLAAAHARGVLHRDLKPANVLIDADGRAYVTDFGIAVPRDRAAPGRAGTPGYMSPEQAAGAPITAACDAWSLAVVIVEMLGGPAVPCGLPGDPASAAAAADAPSLLGRLPPASPPGLRALLERCLARDPAGRLSDLTVVRDALENLRATPRVHVAERTVLVLPFENQHADGDSDYFSDGLTEDVITELSHVEALRVISRATAMRFKGASVDVALASREVGARYVLQGTVRKAGADVRISAQLVDVRADRAIWSDRYLATVDRVFEIQEHVSRAIVTALRLSLTLDDDRRLSARRTGSGNVYDCYLRARRDILSFDQRRLERARDELERARADAGDDPLVLTGLGMAYWQLVNAGFSTDTTYLDRAEACAQRLLALDPAGVHGPLLLAHLSAARGDIAGWVRYGEQAVTAAPRDSDALVWLAMGWTWAGHPDRAQPLFARLEVIDPLYDYLHFGLAFAAQTDGRLDTALGHIRRARALEPQMVGWCATEIQLLLQLGRTDEAAQLARAALPASGTHPLGDMTWALLAAATDDPARARALLTSEIRARLWPDLQYAYFVAQMYAVVGDHAEALRWLERSTTRGFVHHPYLSERDPLLACLRPEPEFQALMARVRSAWTSLRPPV